MPVRLSGKMKKSLLKDILRNIKHNLGQFISIVLILTLGVSFFIGIQVTGHYMRDTGNRYFEQHQLSDAQLTTSLGVTDERPSSFSKVISLKLFLNPSPTMMS